MGKNFKCGKTQVSSAQSSEQAHAMLLASADTRLKLLSQGRPLRTDMNSSKCSCV